VHLWDFHIWLVILLAWMIFSKECHSTPSVGGKHYTIKWLSIYPIARRGRQWVKKMGLCFLIVLHQIVERLFDSIFFHFFLYIIYWGLHNATKVNDCQTTIGKMLGHICCLLIPCSNNSYMPTLFCGRIIKLPWRCFRKTKWQLNS
jgi:hypothetical protein